jgi:hypothetical protein
VSQRSREGFSGDFGFTPLSERRSRASEKALAIAFSRSDMSSEFS